MASQQDQLLASRQDGWKGFSRFLFWGTIHVAIVTLIATLFYVNGPSVGLAIFSVLLFLVGVFVTIIAVLRG